MGNTDAGAFLELVAGRRGHFRLESGHHGGLWLDLDALFADPRRIEPFAAALAGALRPHGVAAVCGPLLGGAFLAQLVARALGVEFCFTERSVPSSTPTSASTSTSASSSTSTSTSDLYKARYRLPPAFATRVRGKRVAMVDDVMSAGSALRGTYAELQARGAIPVVAGALLALGSMGTTFFAEQGVAVETVAQDEYDLWTPASCPLCSAGLRLEDVSAPPSNRET
jgi:orotate phosphoribosyltransferase